MIVGELDFAAELAVLLDAVEPSQETARAAIILVALLTAIKTLPGIEPLLEGSITGLLEMTGS